MNLSRTNRAYFDAAKAVSTLSNHHQAKIGCAVVYKHRIISTGCNSTRTHPIQKKYNCYRFEDDNNHSLHAETQALLPLLNRKDIEFNRVSLYIYREHKDGSLALARPCASCKALISSLGIKHIYFTGESSYISEILM